MDRKRIMIVDDEVSLTRLLKLNLENTGQFEVHTVNHGSEGLDNALQFKPDMILMDVIMPDMDGGAVAEQIRSHPQLKRIPIVFMTAVVSREETEEQRGQIGGYPFLAKPVDVESVTDCIHKYAR